MLIEENQVQEGNNLFKIKILVHWDKVQSKTGLVMRFPVPNEIRTFVVKPNQTRSYSQIPREIDHLASDLQYISNNMNLWQDDI